jgi:hypothetical protein
MESTAILDTAKKDEFVLRGMRSKLQLRKEVGGTFIFPSAPALCLHQAISYTCRDAASAVHSDFFRLLSGPSCHFSHGIIHFRGGYKPGEERPRSMLVHPSSWPDGSWAREFPRGFRRVIGSSSMPMVWVFRLEDRGSEDRMIRGSDSQTRCRRRSRPQRLNLERPPVQDSGEPSISPSAISCNDMIHTAWILLHWTCYPAQAFA